MKQFFITLAAVLFISSAAFAQEKNDDRKTEMIKHRTEQMAKDYNLSDKQKMQLLDLNTKHADMMRPMGPHRHGPHGMKGERPEPPKDMKEKRPDGETGATKGEKPEPPKGDRKAMHEKMEKEMKAYDEALQKIMTPEQYKSYKADMEKRRKEGPRGPRGPRK
jgi:Spy/CpxP family protein refolding chaperone